MSHTPTPWIIEFRSEQPWKRAGQHGVYSTGEDWRHIGDMVKAEDAAFIVKAANSHADLVAALHTALRERDELKRALAEIDEMCEPHTADSNIARLAYDSARAALNQEGRE